MKLQFWNSYGFINSGIAIDYVGAEEKLHLTASVFTSAHEGIMITETGGSIIDVNEAFSRITGYNHDEVLGCGSDSLVSSRQDKKFFAVMRHGLIEKGHWYGEVCNRRKNSEVYAELQTISTVRDSQDPSPNFTQFRSGLRFLSVGANPISTILKYFSALWNLLKHLRQ